MLGAKDPAVARTSNHIANALINLGRYDEAWAYAERSLGLRVDSLGADHPLVAASYNNMAVIRFRQGQPGATKVLVEETLVGLDVLGREAALRMKDGEAVRTDEGNHILDLHLNRIGNARQLGLALNQIAGVVENGLFVDICDALFIGHGDGRVENLDLHGEVEETQFDFLASDNIFTDISD